MSQTTVTTTATAIDGATDNGGTKVCADGNTIIVKSAADCLTSVYNNAAGEPVNATVHVKAGTEKAFTIRQSGLYIVKTETSGNTTTHKIIIK